MRGPISISGLRFEHHPTGLGVHVSTPRLSWRYAFSDDTVPSNWTQTSYEVEIKRAESTDPAAVKIIGASSALNPWPYSPLASRERIHVRVRAEGVSRESTASDDGEIIGTEWSEWHALETALLSRDDWKATLITSSSGTETDRGKRPIRLRKTFKIPADLTGRARLYVTALGLCEAYINGTRVGDDLLSPGWTSYNHRLHYQTYDVRSLLHIGETNTLAIEVAEGWYAGRIVWGEGKKDFYGSEIAALAQLEVFDGSGFDTPSNSDPRFSCNTDPTWEWKVSPIIESGIYDGETYDLREEHDKWCDGQVDANNDSWQPVKPLSFPPANLISLPCTPVRVTQTIKPVRIFTSPSGKTLIDFGQNLVGRIQIQSLQKPDGHRLQIRHAEVLEHGELAVRPLRAAKATDTVIFAQNRELKEWSPRFTFHGFRYVEIEGWSESDDTSPLTDTSIVALVMHTDMERTGHFECSDEMVNKLHENVVWSTRGNFVSIPTDCPQRDERLGWTGDIQVFSPTAAFLFQCDGMLGNWMEDVVTDQMAAGGYVPFVVPDALAKGPWPTIAQAVWDDVVVILPWRLYEWFGNVNVLRASWKGMQTYVDKSLPRDEDGLWDPSVWQLGDWLDPNAPPQDPGAARTDGTLVADEYLIYVTELMSKIAGVLGYTEDQARYRSDYNRLKQAFNDKYIARSGLIVGDSQTSLALALNYTLHQFEPGTLASDTTYQKQRANAAARLARLVRLAKFRVSTGFAGTPAILHALSSTGYLQFAYRMLLEKECPSWLYAVSMGSTTIWERWDSTLPDGSVNPGQMTSFNHYALGAVANWLHTVVGGISPLEPGWQRFLVAPRPGGDITSAKVEFNSPSGMIKCEWNITKAQEQERFAMKLNVPPNSTALVVLPNGNGMDDMDSRGKLLGSGCYHFESDYSAEGPWPPKAFFTEFQEES